MGTETDQVNDCRSDIDNRYTRARDCADFTIRDGPMTRTIAFDVGWDHLDHGCGHGLHGMTLRFVLRGPAGEVQWAVNMPNWLPGNTTAIGAVNGDMSPVSMVTCTRTDDLVPVDLRYHSPHPTREGEEEQDDSDLLPGGVCYYDGSALNARPVLEQFLVHGPMAVWAALARYYAEIFDGRPGS